MMPPRTPRPTEDMDDKLAKTLASPDFVAWRARIWKEISDEAIGKGWVPENEQTEDGVIDPYHERWRQLHARMVEIRYLFRLPVSRSVHAKFLHSAKGQKVVDVGFLSFHTSPHPSEQDKKIFEARRKELLEWRARGGKPPTHLSLRYLGKLGKPPKAR